MLLREMPYSTNFTNLVLGRYVSRSDIEEFEVAKGVIRIHISKMNRQDNAKQKGQKDNNDLQNIYIKLIYI
jgi:hypothetical protein